MATITIRNLPEDLVKTIKSTAKKHGVSMEHEIRELLKSMFMQKKELLDLIRSQWDDSTTPSVHDVNKWRHMGRE
ncbi:MAG: hypothetical protein JXJ04_03335 [Spirochaetales bacterium]|nr:hypothetical protein [Spirochaetales bacterium]